MKQPLRAAVLVCAIAAGALAQQSTLPQREPVTITDYRELVGVCTAERIKDQQYIQMLQRRIVELEAKHANK